MVLVCSTLASELTFENVDLRRAIFGEEKLQIFSTCRRSIFSKVSSLVSVLYVKTVLLTFYDEYSVREGSYRKVSQVYILKSQLASKCTIEKEYSSVFQNVYLRVEEILKRPSFAVLGEEELWTGAVV